nr:MAG: capsid protein [Cressdnaviricota sp.]
MSRTRPNSHWFNRMAKGARVGGSLLGGAARVLRGRSLTRTPPSTGRTLRRSRSRSRTRTRSSRRRQVRNNDTAGSQSAVRHHFRLKGKVKKGTAGAPSRLQTNQEYFQTSPTTAGALGWIDISSMDQPALTQLENAAQDQLQYVINGAVTATNTPIRPYIDYTTTEIIYQNTGLSSVLITLYDYVVKRDNALGAYASMTNTIAAGDSAGRSTLSTANLTPAVPGFCPTDSSVFSQNFSIRKVSKFFLAGGEQHRHVIKSVYNGAVEEQLVNLAVTPNVVFRGVTYGCLASIRGQIVVGTTSGYDTAPTELRAYSIWRAHTRPMFGISHTHNDWINAITPIVGQPKLMEEAVGQVVQGGTGILGGVLNI